MELTKDKLFKETKEKSLKALEIKNEKEDINKKNDIYKILIKETNDILEIIDLDGNIKYINGISEKVMGYKPEDLIGKNIYDFHRGYHLSILKKMIKDAIQFPNKVIQELISFNNNLGKKIYLDVRIKNLINEPTIEGIVINFRDITNSIKKEEQKNYIFTYDRPTGLPDHNYLNKQLEIECKLSNKENTTFALIVVDIDNIKNISYSLGDIIANKLILKMSKQLVDFSKLHEEIFVSRIAYDQFGLIIKGLKKHEDYRKIAEELILLFSSPYSIEKYELDVTVNIGACIYPDDVKYVHSMRKKINSILIRAKKEGKNKIKFYSPDLDIQNYKEYLIRTHLRHAVRKKELKLYYQPIVNLKNHKILAGEALIRWEHPDWGIVSPNDFIPLAEETGVIVDIGEWVLREVCYNYKQWIKKGLPEIKVSINVSSVQFLESNFVEHIKTIINEFELDPHFLIIEITENTIIKQTNKIISDIKKLRELGIEIAIDDFGTGFSSLSYLNLFDIDILKIDKSFIKNCVLDKTSNIITSTIINMVKKLKIKSAAKGIETWEQLNYLRELNCIVGQGFLYSKPVDVETFEKLLYKGKCNPVIVNNLKITSRTERRRFFRVKFFKLLEANLTIKEIKGKKVKVGNTKVLVQNIGPGGLCFISNIKLPVEKYFIIQFTTELIEKTIKVNGQLAWLEEIDDNLYKYGVEFIIDEKERYDLIKILNKVQIKIKKDILFSDGSFTNDSPKKYFNSIIK
ncbi:GGDEF domain-containing phosphodiesterase [Defluviitalea phaphyphila]|uniref:GGDEF domain-containing phosphodiesterase n=1 Tax=Defluviitalea phaphyphila TaxID=1473580 RepID=UPI00073131D5|nr:GGDEF domain-containing phosphodiesterase [Defluviitalea phaphyphila]